MRTMREQAIFGAKNKMRNQPCKWICAGMLCASQASACSPDPTFQYDDIRSAEIGIAIAHLTKVTWEFGAKTCLSAVYEDAEYLYGAGSSEFLVNTCGDWHVSPELLQEDSDILNFMGLFRGATVIVGLVSSRPGSDDLRFATPSCWGWLHYNFDAMNKQERDQFLAEIESLKAPDTQ